jgi:hypothetical protein
MTSHEAPAVTAAARLGRSGKAAGARGASIPLAFHVAAGGAMDGVFIFTTAYESGWRRWIYRYSNGGRA